MYIRLENVLGDMNILESYILFRTIEDWCYNNVIDGNWHFDYKRTICAYGVDIAGGIEFNRRNDSIAFINKFRNINKF